MVKKPKTADQIWVRRMNRSIIMETLRTNRTLSRAGLAAKTGLNPSTVSSIINELLKENLVRETHHQQSANGRPGLLLELNPDGGTAIGLEINVDYISIILTDFTANILWRRRTRFGPEAGQESILNLAKCHIQEALEQAKTTGLRILGMGVGVPGLVDLTNGNLVLAPNLKWHNVPVQKILCEQFNLPVYVENEANAAALGEYYFGAAREVENFIYLSAGIGLGGGIIIGGQLFRGSSGYASEVGHMSLDSAGELCGCGKRGCWETFAGPRAVERRVRKTLQEGATSMMVEMVGGDLERINFEIVVEAAKAGDPVALAALKEVGHWLGIGVANLANIFNPDLIVLGGALNLASTFLLPVVEETLAREALFPSRENLRFTASEHGTDACVMGAVALVLDDILREPTLS